MQASCGIRIATFVVSATLWLTSGVLPAHAQFGSDGSLDSFRNLPGDMTIEESLNLSSQRLQQLQNESRLALLRRMSEAYGSSLDPTEAERIEATYRFFESGVTMLGDGEPQRAIDEVFDPLLETFEQTISEQTLPTFVARNTLEGMYYILLAASRDIEAQSIQSYGTDAYYWKAVAQRQLGDREGADQSLARALELSPAHPWLVTENAHRLRNSGDFTGALTSFERAAESARLLSTESLLAAELGFALRGRAEALVDLGRFDEAVAQFEECLELDPDDFEAGAGLAYVTELMRRRGL